MSEDENPERVKCSTKISFSDEENLLLSDFIGRLVSQVPPEYLTSAQVCESYDNEYKIVWYRPKTAQDIQKEEEERRLQEERAEQYRLWTKRKAELEQREAAERAFYESIYQQFSRKASQS